MIKTPAIKFENEQLFILDQTLLPIRTQYIEINSVETAYEAIFSLRVRGAPAIGIMAAYSLYIIARQLYKTPYEDFKTKLDTAAEYLIKSRPTAVNLAWAIHQIQNVLKYKGNNSVEEMIQIIRDIAIRIHDEDKKACEKIGKNGLTVLSNPCQIITHCNTGALATGGWGTALGVVYAAVEKNYDIHVYVDETRPLGQGARLTFWELKQNKIPATLITDSTAAFLMKQKKIDVVIYGADRITKDGDVANKIGSYALAVAARHHDIPCYVAAPFSTFDFTLADGNQIPIEERSGKEILQIYEYNNNLLSLENVYNPAFDITPAYLLSGIITEYGVLRPPLKQAINKVYKQILEETK